MAVYSVKLPETKDHLPWTITPLVRKVADPLVGGRHQLTAVKNSLNLDVDVARKSLVMGSVFKLQDQLSDNFFSNDYWFYSNV